MTNTTEANILEAWTTEDGVRHRLRVTEDGSLRMDIAGDNYDDAIWYDDGEDNNNYCLINFNEPNVGPKDAEERWISHGLPHRLLVTPRGELKLEVNFDEDANNDWAPMDNGGFDDCLIPDAKQELTLDCS